ncbi:hypothetical protein FOA43_002581 [Brettanomyces nanus]|uniref:Rhodanese domain-containing protein n=1 Tax=Eeniella nana TaxID=13502 RepID=A0A875S0C6_EENNA|nr:uncharacterized protein FOA43_002581 [Brettanomyces nanus]QPG75231.1 hypothetical protein FOA43_002581 [Brettanomyces nanus]
MPSKQELLEEVARLRAENDLLKKKCNKISTLPLNREEYRRYGRQMQVPEFGGLNAQVKLKNSKLLVIGAGGLGCPALLYLAAAGIGQIGIVDHDTVDITNLHRQVIHDTNTVGMFKAESAQIKIQALNPNVKVVTYCEALTNTNCFDIVESYDIVLDCTDNPASRYLINDTCVLLGKTIVSGSGLKTEGQLSILNFHNKGPCYRCFYPKPPPPNSVTSCSDGGVIGPCIGLLGVMMAIEALKCLTEFYTDENFRPFLALYSGYSPQQKLRTFKMRGRSPTCEVCKADCRKVTRKLIESGKIDYENWCGSLNYEVLDSNTERISAKQLAQIDFGVPTINPLIDVRPEEQYDIAHLDHSINIPYAQLSQTDFLPESIDPTKPTYVICRFGRDSQLSTKALQNRLANVKDVIGGLDAWQREVDSDFPVYW